ncbi:hypothetical protein [Silvibacterium dinghuense]|uniref:Uncharacterized protein n=1 Tax=Silvibacterium dinghuense TaxID=1560006 RepID=A0A4Q1S9M9_9BACT|nr:hypothetical protein [Silvibacterium dinghuense]RXS93766.1 hypothetical protein ESZ00_17110 [Silvibacterium dinghuense]GGH07434.1 hypothetical protein GCM10011586_24690 [Silvibacterium dinghuense]
MSLIRNIARRLAEFTVRHASPGSKPWAEAIAAELDCIGNDWRALNWACGSLRVLAHYRPAPIHTMEELAAEAEKFASRRRGQATDLRTGRYLIWAAGLIWIALIVAHIGHRKDPVGSLLMLATQATLFFAQFLHSRYLFLRDEVPDQDDAHAVILYYRQQLQRSLRLAALDLLPMLLILASLVYDLRSSLWFISIVCLTISAFVLSYTRRRLGSRFTLEQIDALLTER